MTKPRITEIERRLDEVLINLKQSKDPTIKRNLLAEMRKLIAELEGLVYSVKTK